jgi:hypothetical protein
MAEVRTWIAAAWAWILGERRSTGCRDRLAARRRARELEREAADPDGAAQAQAGLSDALALLIADTESRANAKPPRASRATIGLHQKEAAVLLAALAPNGTRSGRIGARTSRCAA